MYPDFLGWVVFHHVRFPIKSTCKVVPHDLLPRWCPTSFTWVYDGYIDVYIYILYSVSYSWVVYQPTNISLVGHRNVPLRYSKYCPGLWGSWHDIVGPCIGLCASAAIERPLGYSWDYRLVDTWWMRFMCLVAIKYMNSHFLAIKYMNSNMCSIIFVVCNVSNLLLWKVLVSFRYRCLKCMVEWSLQCVVLFCIGMYEPSCVRQSWPSLSLLRRAFGWKWQRVFCSKHI